MSAPAPVAVVGAGWAGAAAAHRLHRLGLAVHVYERAPVTGGHSRAERLRGVLYEPNGPHIFHTANPEVAALVGRHGMARRYEHRVLTEVYLHEDDDAPRLLAWPPQVSELRELPLWPRVAAELAARPRTPSRTDLEAYCVSIMGRTLFDLFIRDYTEKQWGRSAHELSAAFAPGRLELRDDGYRRLFRDPWEFFPPDGPQTVIDSLLVGVPVTTGARLGIGDLDDLARRHSAVVLTAPLDEFTGRTGELAWRGIRTVSCYEPTHGPGSTATPGYVVNRPSHRVPYTRTVETKHASGQRVQGTVVSYEYPGSAERHYPVPTPDRRYERRNAELKDVIRARSPIPVHFCGRLADYTYINQDRAIEQGLACARQVADHLLHAADAPTRPVRTENRSPA
ncbi:UDP-galactopyranose mutase [Kitasatospora sp. NPDC056446]|uniref:UDP-galactopyranose mutase n=1 Tax=Kitasatospora sp. NPDC056446 TaxID=3345819 RepID=UPI0036AE929D